MARLVFVNPVRGASRFDGTACDTDPAEFYEEQHELGRGHCGVVVDLPDDRSIRRFTPPRESHRLGPLWRWPPVRDRGLCLGLRRLRALRPARIAAWREDRVLGSRMVRLAASGPGVGVDDLAFSGRSARSEERRVG